MLNLEAIIDLESLDSDIGPYSVYSDFARAAVAAQLLGDVEGTLALTSRLASGGIEPRRVRNWVDTQDEDEIDLDA